MNNFDQLPWHDALIQFIKIDRRMPGEKDIVNLFIEWPDKKTCILEFFDCYKLQIDMNFGIIAVESILEAKCINENEILKEIRNEWLINGIDLSNLKCYQIITNSTGSNINIFSFGFKILE